MNQQRPNPRLTSDPFDTIPDDDGEVIRRNSRSFAFAARWLPEPVRKDVEKLYAWCRWCDDAVDSSATVTEASTRLELLRDDVQRIYDGKPTEHQASDWLAELVQKHQLAPEYPFALLECMETDLELEQIRTEAELLRYCYQAAGVVGLMMCRVFGVTDPRAFRHAKSLGIAMQLTNIARDVQEDSRRGRCYLPQDWLEGGVHASSGDDIRRAVRRALDLADEYYSVAFEGMRYLPTAVRSAIRVAAAVYREIGQEIRRQDYRVMQGRVTTPIIRFFTAALWAWARGRIADTKSRLGWAEQRPVQEFHSFNLSTVPTMNDAKYLFYLGLSLTAFMSSAAFLTVTLNPKEASYATLPVVYAVVCFAVGLVTQWLAKRAESDAPVPIRVRSANEMPHPNRNPTNQERTLT